MTLALFPVFQDRLSELDNALELSLDEIFVLLCDEFELDADALIEKLGAPCPFGLAGFLEAELTQD